MSSMNYTKPEDVTAPKDYWALIKILVPGGPGEMAWALGTWEGEVRLACRWNGFAEHPKGNPISNVHPTWMLLGRSESVEVIQALGLVSQLLDLIEAQHKKLN